MHAEIKSDSVFNELSQSSGLLWEDEGNEPRGYHGPAPESVRVLYVGAEPGPVTATERQNFMPAINTVPWIDGHDLIFNEHYWRKKLLVICSYIWPENIINHMDNHLGGMHYFWISLPEGSTTKSIPRPVLEYWRKKYARRLFGLFPDAIVLAAGSASNAKHN